MKHVGSDIIAGYLYLCITYINIYLKNTNSYNIKEQLSSHFKTGGKNYSLILQKNRLKRFSVKSKKPVQYSLIILYISYYIKNILALISILKYGLGNERKRWGE